MPLIDLHIDTLVRCLDPQVDLLRGAPDAHVDIPRLETAGVVAAVWAACDDVFLDGTAGVAHVLRMIGAGRNLVARSNGRLRLIETATDLERCSPGGPIGLLLAVEGAHSLLGSLRMLEAYRSLGVRLLTLTWNHDNPFASGCRAAGDEDGGVTPLGRELILRAQELHILLDLAHASPRTLTEAVAQLDGPFLVSHTACHALVPHRRNLTDRQLGEVSRAGGLIGITLYPPFLAGEGGTASIETLAAHVNHAVEVAGEDAVGIGTDLDGITKLPMGVTGIQDLTALPNALGKMGLSSGVVEKILWRNAARVMGHVLPREQ